MILTGRFHTWLPESGKKADLMFVQHMMASLKQTGRMAVVMPHGVLFRSGEERACRKRMIEDGVLEAVIGLPQGLFYGTGIPACVLVVNKNRAAERKHVIFINADREYKEGKNQNSLRPEDIEKITHVYKALSDTTESELLAKLDKVAPANKQTNKVNSVAANYAKRISIEDLAAEDYNLNIRRYVDNSPPPEPHDVRAHLNGGIPTAEVAALAHYWQNFAGLQQALFTGEGDYLQLADAIGEKSAIKPTVEQHPAVQAQITQFNTALDNWRAAHYQPAFFTLGDLSTGSKGMFAFRRDMLNSGVEALLPQGLLDIYKIRGALASHFKKQEADLKSVANSGWNAELIPDDQILASQFPQILAGIKQDQARITELEALFAAADESDSDDTENESEPDEIGVLPKAQVKTLKDAKKDHNGQIRDLKKQVKYAKKEAKAGQTEAAEHVEELEAEIAEYSQALSTIDEQLATHSALEEELKNLKAGLRDNEKKRDDLVQAAREKISAEEAKLLIEARFKQQLSDEVAQYLRAYIAGLVKAVENLHNKYAVTVKQILAERDEQATLLDGFMRELGYE